MKRISLVVSLTLIALLAVASSASAATYNATNDATLATALSSAESNPGPDTVNVAAGNYTVATTTFYFAPSSTNTISIIGAGSGQTIFTRDLTGSPDSVAMDVSLPNGDSFISGFTLNANLPTNYLSGLGLHRGGIENFAINQTGSAGYAKQALDMYNGVTANDGSITTSGQANGINALNGGATVRRVSITGDNDGAGLLTGGTVDGFFSRLKIKGFKTGVQQGDGHVEIEDSTIETPSVANAIGVYVLGINGGTAETVDLSAKRLTIIGRGTSSKGIYTWSQEAIDQVTADFQDVVVYGEANDYQALNCTEVGSNTNTTEFEGIATRSASAPSADCVFSSTLIQLNASPFANFAAGDFTPKAGSGLIDTAAGGNTAGEYDQAGNPRIVDGDGDGTATMDIGAYEYQRRAPTVALLAAKSELALLETTTFTATASDPEGEALAYSWTIDGVASPFSGEQLVGGFVTSGPHQVRVTVTDEAGASSVAMANVNVTAPPAPPAANQTCPSLRVATPRKSFVRSGKGFGNAKRNQPYFSVKVDQVTSVKLTLQKLVKKKYKSVKGSQSLTLKIGTNKLGFGGKFGGKKLAAGSYRVTIKLATPCGSAKAMTATLKLKK